MLISQIIIYTLLLIDIDNIFSSNIVQKAVIGIIIP